LFCVVLAALVSWAWLAARPSRAQTSSVLHVSGMALAGSKPVAIVRLTNASPNPADIFSVHYTVRDVSAGIPLSHPGAGIGAELRPGRSIELDLGKIVTQYRAGVDVGPFTGPIQFVAYGEGGSLREFGPDTIHVEVRQVEGSAVRDAAVEWLAP
jgi:hypothetical protein